jgi:hypothetical protein
MNIKITIAFCCIILLFTSCSHIYEPALYHQDIAYQPKPASFDTTKTANYLSGGFNAYSNTNLNDFVISGQFNLSRGYAFKNFNLAYGAFGVFGQYESDQANSHERNYFSNKYFGAVGGRFSADVFTSSRRADFRFIGIEVAYSHEFGTYSEFRNYLDTQPGYYVDPRTDLFTVGVTTEVIFHNEGNIGFQHGIRGFLGGTLGYDNLTNTFYNNPKASTNILGDLTFSTLPIFAKVSYFIKVKNYFGTVEAGNGFFVRFGYRF